MKAVLLLLLLVALGLTVSSATACEPPVVQVELTCDPNAILAIQVSATDPGGDLIELCGSILEYGTLEDCRSGGAYRTTNIWRNYLHDVFEPRSAAQAVERLDCVSGLWYKAVARAIDSHGDDDIERTECCQCDRTIAPIEATTWARIKAQYR